MNRPYEDNRATRHNPRETAWKPEKAKGGGRLAAALVVGALAAAGAVSLFHGSAKANKTPEETPLDRLAAQEQVIDASKMLGDQLQHDAKAQEIAKHIQAELDAKAKSIAGSIITDYNHPKQAKNNAHVNRTAELDGDGNPRHYTYVESTDGNGFDAGFGAKDGHANLHDLTRVTVLRDYGDDPTTSHSQSIDRVTYPDGTTAWSYVAIGAETGPGSGADMDYRSPDHVDTMDELVKVEQQIKIRLPHM